ncbi:MAG TPA: hypothetical protein VFN67_02450 [Polyangiales bacterium]|nr:hypothetical protein [Polyangiales bacterium]
MQARLSAVQHALIVVTVVAFVVAALVHPALDNADYRRALAELTSLKQRFDRSGVEAALLANAKAQGNLPLLTLTREVRALRPITLQLAQPSAALEPLAQLKIATLADIDRYAQPGANLPLTVADVSSLANGLAWRLTRDSVQDTTATLRSAQLQLASVSAADLELEAQIAQLQTEQASAKTSAEKTTAEQERISVLYENRVKWRVSKQLRSDTYKSLLDARKAQRDAERALRDVTKRYEAAMAKASTAPAAAASGEFGVVQIDIAAPGGDKRYAIPVRTKVVQAQLPPLHGVALRQTRAAGLWDQLKDLTPAQATSAVEERFNWHNRYFDLAGFKLGGAVVLQLAPCVLPLLLWLLLVRIRHVAETYNPFRTRLENAMPRVGFRTRPLEALALMVLPLVATAFAIASLMILGQMPALPLAAAVASLLLGVYAFVKLGELQRLMEDVVRSHSHPPPPDPSNST